MRHFKEIVSGQLREKVIRIPRERKAPTCLIRTCNWIGERFPDQRTPKTNDVLSPQTGLNPERTLSHGFWCLEGVRR